MSLPPPPLEPPAQVIHIDSRMAADAAPLRRARGVLQTLDDAALLAVAGRVAEMLRVQQRRPASRPVLDRLAGRLDVIAADLLEAADDVDTLRNL